MVAMDIKTAIDARPKHMANVGDQKVDDDGVWPCFKKLLYNGSNQICY